MALLDVFFQQGPLAQDIFKGFLFFSDPFGIGRIFPEVRIGNLFFKCF